jgi:hypothetical protein
VTDGPVRATSVCDMAGGGAHDSAAYD